jgi:hypothetical protein
VRLAPGFVERETGANSFQKIIGGIRFNTVHRDNLQDQSLTEAATLIGIVGWT